jgi:flavodoxin
MKTAIIYYSYHHGNTKKVIDRMAGILGAKLMTPPEVDATKLAEYDLIGFGSGIYFSKPHKSLLDLVDSLPSMKNKKAFIISTSGRGEKGMEKNHHGLKAKLEGKGFAIVGEYSCSAFDTFLFFRLMGGLNKGRPNEDDLKKAEEFAKKLSSGS